MLLCRERSDSAKANCPAWLVTHCPVSHQQRVERTATLPEAAASKRSIEGRKDEVNGPSCKRASNCNVFHTGKVTSPSLSTASQRLPTPPNRHLLCRQGKSCLGEGCQGWSVCPTPLLVEGDPGRAAVPLHYCLHQGPINMEISCKWCNALICIVD